MGEYQFEMIAAVSDIITVEASSVEEACDLAYAEAEAYYAVAPQGFSIPWDNVDTLLISEPDEDDE